MGVVTHPPRKTRFRLLVQLYRTGLVTRRVPSERFQASDYPPFPSFLARCRPHLPCPCPHRAIDRLIETVARIPGYRIMPPSPCAESWWSEPGLGRAAPAAGPAPAGPRSPTASEPG